MVCQIGGAPLGTQMPAPKNECRGRDEKTIPRRDGNRKTLIYYLSVDQIDTQTKNRQNWLEIC